MIELSPLDIRKKKEDFRRILRGYDPEQVDAFLELVADRLGGLVAEDRTRRERLGVLEEKLERYEEREKALNDALMAAQELREEARAQAEREAELRIREAESRAEQIVQEAREEERAAERKLEDLRVRRERFLRSFRDTLERFLEELEAEQARLRADPGHERPSRPADGAGPRPVVERRDTPPIRLEGAGGPPAGEGA